MQPSFAFIAILFICATSGVAGIQSMPKDRQRMKRLSEPSTFKLPKLHGGQGLFPGITYSRDKNIQPDFRQFYERPWWKPNPYIPMDSVLVKRNFDLIDGAGFGSFVKRESGSTDTGIINNEKRNFDQIDGAGFGAFYRR